VLAKPPVRKLAKSLGVDLDRVQPTGPNGTVSREDVTQAANGDGAALSAAPQGTASTGTAVAVVARNQPGARETRVPVRGVRKHTAAAMVSSAFTAPHVTEFVTVDVSATMELRDRIAARRDFAGVKVSPLLFVARAVILAAKRTPEINATWDGAAGEIVLKHYVNLGIAAATDRGLIVPNVKDADALSLRDLAAAIVDLTETARAGRTLPADMSGGTITITNVGVFGVDTGTPILNPGETGIVAFGAVRRMPWVVPGADGTESVVPRWVTQLAVSFDHRVVDGQQGSQFLSDVAGVLTDPGLALL
jgi:pyruvate dehydrogenase E2 component (dihydrolipoamide acetyltransferase)